MISSKVDNRALLEHLSTRFNNKPISKSTLVMACHYFLRENCESSCNKVDEIEKRISDLFDARLLVKKNDSIFINYSSSIL